MFVVLKKSDHIEKFLVDFTDDAIDMDQHILEHDSHILDIETLTDMLDSMDSEYYKNVLRTVLALCHTRPELCELGCYKWNAASMFLQKQFYK